MSGQRRSTYRTLRNDEPDPPGEALTYNATDGCVVRRWKIGPREYVERPVRTPDGGRLRWKPMAGKRVDVDEALTRYEAGESLPTIARAMQVNAANLSRLLRRHGATMRPPGDYAVPFDPELVVHRYSTGEGHVAIARDLGVSVSRVTAALRSAGVPLRGSGRVKGRGRQGGAVTYETEFQAARPLVRRRSGGRCEASASPSCSGRATHVHHRQIRAQGGSNDLGNLLDCCAWCHAFIHANPALSYERGWLVRRAAPA